MYEHITTKQPYHIVSVTSPICHNILEYKISRKYYEKQAYSKYQERFQKRSIFFTLTTNEF